FRQRLPGVNHIVGISHIRHRATGGHVREDDLLMGLGEHIGALSHEMNATEDNVVCVGSLRSLLRELERIPAQISVADNLVSLIMMSEYYQPLTQFFFCLLYALSKLIFREHTIERRQRLVDRRIGRDHVILTRARSVVGRHRSVEVPRDRKSTRLNSSHT